ncbi:MAG: ABC transporter ATP-binding protein [Clostridiales bacterium]|nr:ABC transporter ATP-binding protein [Clostridiales bacterium]
MKTLFRYVGRKGGVIGFCLLVKFSGTVLELLLPWMLSVILDDYVPLRDLPGILRWGGLMVLAAEAALLCNAMANRLSTRISRDITRRLRYDLFERVMGLSSAQEDAFTTSSLIARLSSDTYNVHQMVDRMQRLGVRAPILLLGGMAVTFLLEPVLTLVLVAVLPLLALIVFSVSRRGVARYTETQGALDVLVRRAQESMAGVRVIQALSKTGYEVARFDEANAAVMRRDRRAGLLMNVTNPAMNLFLNVGLTAVIVVGAYRVNAGVTQPGVIIAFLSYFTIILSALMMVSRLFVLYSKGAASAKRIEEVLQAPQDMAVRCLPARADEAHIRFDGVHFSYGKKRDNLYGISFSLRRGETLGIIGPTGSGKSTLLQLLLRFYDVDQGHITIDGQDLRSVPKERLYSLFGVVFQNDFLFAGEIGENIDFGRGLSPEQLERAIETAQAGFVYGRAGGLAAELTPKGGNLSGGQRQRVLLARALAADPDILILDDSSSALDYKTDAQFRHALAKNFRRATKLIVAQRVSAIRHADQILVLDQGRAIGLGTHEELLRSCESYREIAQLQMGEVG